MKQKNNTEELITRVNTEGELTIQIKGSCTEWITIDIESTAAIKQ